MEKEFAKAERVSFKAPFAVSMEKDKDRSKEKKLEFLQESDRDAVMLVSVYYQLLSGRLVIYVDVDLYPRSAHLQGYAKRFDAEDLLGKDNLIYRMGFRYSRSETATEEDVISMLEEGTLKLAEHLAKELNTPVEEQVKQ